MTQPPRSIEMIRRLIAFDTTSRNPNLEMIEFIRDTLADLGVRAELTFDGDKKKANLFATLGPDDRPGICLSGHSDVVPVDGQDWHSDPFVLDERDGCLYGRGTADMKSFLAIALAFAPDFLAAATETPIHLAVTFDEEVGCLGVPHLIAALAKRPVRPAMCLVGEPTGMQVITGHKGKQMMICRVRGLEGHSAYTDKAVNAVEIAAELIARLRAIARGRAQDGPFVEGFEPPYTTVHTGVVRGGTALNIVPAECVFEFEVRDLPGDDPAAVLAEIREFAERELLPEMTAVSDAAGIVWETGPRYPALDTGDDSEVVRLAKRLSRNNDSGKVSFGTEAGLYHEAHIPTVVCGPGDIAQAHKPDEFISLEQVARCEDFMTRLIEELRSA